MCRAVYAKQQGLYPAGEEVSAPLSYSPYPPPLAPLGLISPSDRGRSPTLPQPYPRGLFPLAAAGGYGHDESRGVCELCWRLDAAGTCAGHACAPGGRGGPADRLTSGRIAPSVASVVCDQWAARQLLFNLPGSRCGGSLSGRWAWPSLEGPLNLRRLCAIALRPHRRRKRANRRRVIAQSKAAACRRAPFPFGGARQSPRGGAHHLS